MFGAGTSPDRSVSLAVRGARDARGAALVAKGWFMLSFQSRRVLITWSDPPPAPLAPLSPLPLPKSVLRVQSRARGVAAQRIHLLRSARSAFPFGSDQGAAEPPLCVYSLVNAPIHHGLLAVGFLPSLARKPPDVHTPSFLQELPLPTPASLKISYN